MKTTISTGGFDYKGLDASARGFVLERAESIHQLARRTAQGIVQIGQYLTEVRDRLGHGNFLPWVEQEFAWTRHTAERFMNVYDQFKLRNLRNLEIDVSALYLIAAKSTPEPVKAEVMRRAELGEKVKHSTLKAVIAEYRENSDGEAAIGKIFEVVQAAQQQQKQEVDRLPSPAEARRMAIASGAHTPDRNGAFQPPITKEEQAAWHEEMRRVEPLWEFLRLTKANSPAKLAQIIKARGWAKDYDPLSQLADAGIWLEEFQEAMCQKEKEKK